MIHSEQNNWGQHCIIYKYQVAYLLSGSSQGDQGEDDGQREEDNVDALAASRPHRLT